MRSAREELIYPRPARPPRRARPPWQVAPTGTRNTPWPTSSEAVISDTHVSRNERPTGQPDNPSNGHLGNAFAAVRPPHGPRPRITLATFRSASSAVAQRDPLRPAGGWGSPSA